VQLTLNCLDFGDVSIDASLAVAVQPSALKQPAGKSLAVPSGYWISRAG